MLQSEKDLKGEILDKFKQLGPINIEELLEGNDWICFDENIYEYREQIKKRGVRMKGQFNKDKDRFEGIVRQIRPDRLQDGLRRDGIWQGLARSMDSYRKIWILGERSP